MFSFKSLSVAVLASTSAVLAMPIQEITEVAGHPSNLFKRDDTIWCGAIKQGTNFHEVSGQWKIPQLSLRQGQTKADNTNIPIWVGIDGYGCAGLLQAGTTSFVSKNEQRRNLKRVLQEGQAN